VKQCSRCGESKPLDQYYRDKRASDGLYSHCKSCHRTHTDRWKGGNRERVNMRTRERRAADPEPFRASYRRHYAGHREERKADSRRRYWTKRPELLEQQKAWRERNHEATREHAKRRRDETPEVARAYNAVYYAVKTGKLIRPERCPRCDRECKVEAHHADYSKPLDVTWLCKWCHEMEHHGTEGPAVLDVA
jgi:ribosomal protein S27AE